MTIKSIFVASPLSTHNLGTTSKNVKIQYGEMLDLSILSAILNVRHEETVSVSVLSSNAVDRVFEPRSSQTKDYQIGIFCFSALKNKNKDWLARGQDNVSEWGNMSTNGLWSQ
jgi:hypothetical protein